MANIKKINLPKLPNDIVIEILNNNINGRNEAFDNHPDEALNFYKWVSANEKVQTWCKENISQDIHWGIQIIEKDLPIHNDLGTLAKFNYVIANGGNDVVTNFYDDEKTLIDSHNLELNQWYILNVEIYHNVQNIQKNSKRISITGRIMP